MCLIFADVIALCDFDAFYGWSFYEIEFDEFNGIRESRFDIFDGIFGVGVFVFGGFDDGELDFSVGSFEIEAVCEIFDFPSFFGDSLGSGWECDLFVSGEFSQFHVIFLCCGV